MRGERNVSDLERFEFGSGGERRVVEWQPPDVAPAGRRHRSAGVCFASDGRVVIVGEDGELWGLPGGRPEGDEGWRDTFEREVHEEACAVVGDAALLGFGRAVCLEGVERGLVLVRALWRAEVELQDGRRGSRRWRGSSWHLGGWPGGWLGVAGCLAGSTSGGCGRRCRGNDR
jgi:ADP-ribose pyrophosphatase YjhB (NUDIX family)